jgi:hypothetical protein
VREKTARLGFLISLLLLALVGLALSSLFANENRSSSEAGQKISQVLERGRVLPGSSGPTKYYKFYLKDASVLGAVLPGTEPDPSLISGATVVVLNPSSFTCGDSGSDYNFVESSGFYKLVCKEASTMQIQISKSGYTTKTTSLAYYQGEIPTIYLSTYVAPPPPPETIKDVTLPKVFGGKGSQTTDLSKIKNPAKVKNLTLDTKKATIKFKEAINLSSTSIRNKFKKLDKYISMSKTAIIDLESKSLKELNKKASVTMKKLPWVSTPRVLVNGKENKNVVSNITFSKGTLTFDVKHFSTLKAAPGITVSEPLNNFEVNEKQTNLKAVVSDPTASISVKLNNQDLGKIEVAADSGEFIVPLNLLEGYNQIVIKAKSSNGTSDQVVLDGSLVIKNKNLLLYLVIGFLALVAGGLMIYTFLQVKKNKNEGSPPKETET